MSQQNPYLAPQSPLSGGGVPMANSALPREMLVVADGMKFVLWGIIIGVIGAIVAAVMAASAIGAGFDQGARGVRPGDPNFDAAFMAGANAAGSGLRMTVIVATVIGLIANLVSLFGMFKCTQIPLQSGAKQVAQYAFYGSIAVLLINLLNNVMGFSNANTSRLMQVINILSAIISIATLFFFISFLKKTSAYLGDALAIERSGKLMTLVLVAGGCYIVGVLIAIVLATGNANAQGMAGGGMFAAILMLVAAVAAIWGFFVYLGTLTRIKNVIEAGTR